MTGKAVTGFELVAGVIGIFFGAGLAVGVLLVAALSVFRRRKVRDYPDLRGWQPRIRPRAQDEKSQWWQDR